LILVGFLGIEPPQNSKVARILSAVAYLGKISYGLYVFHLLAIRTVAGYGGRFPFNLAFSLFLTGVMAILSYELLEAPFLRLKKRFTKIASRPV
jgi:peptidoglycan/LPS O-acetylase OafA/YrhL